MSKKKSDDKPHIIGHGPDPESDEDKKAKEDMYYIPSADRTGNVHDDDWWDDHRFTN